MYVPTALLLGFLRSCSNNTGTDGIASLIFLILFLSNLAVCKNSSYIDQTKLKIPPGYSHFCIDHTITFVLNTFICMKQFIVKGVE